MKNRILSYIIMGLVFSPVVLFGGGNQGTTNVSQNNAAALREAGFNETGYPIVKKPYTLRLFHRTRHQDTPSFETLEIFQKLEKKTGGPY